MDGDVRGRFESSSSSHVDMDVGALLEHAARTTAKEKQERDEKVTLRIAECTRIATGVLASALRQGLVVEGDIAIIKSLGANLPHTHRVEIPLHNADGGRLCKDDRETWDAVARNLEALNCGDYEWKAVRLTYGRYVGFVVQRKGKAAPDTFADRVRHVDLDEMRFCIRMMHGA
jgi:hypothetical protein